MNKGIFANNIPEIQAVSEWTLWKTETPRRKFKWFKFSTAYMKAFLKKER